MSFYELATLETAFGAAGKVAESAERWVTEGNGRLCGAWSTDIGALNRIIVLREFEDLASLYDERERALRSEDPFGCAAHLVSLSMDSYKKFDFMPKVEAGALGPVYEIRTYRLKVNGLVPTIDKWNIAVPERSAYSKLAAAMYALDGQPRITHIWPYASLEERSQMRAQSVNDGKWPPKGGPDWLTTDMVSQIALPLPFSPLK